MKSDEQFTTAVVDDGSPAATEAADNDNPQDHEGRQLPSII